VNTPLDSILSGDRASAPSPETPTPARQEPPAQEAAQQPQPASEAEPETHELPDGRKTVPIEALHAERGKVKRYTEEVADFRKQLQESNAAWERRMAQVLEAVKPKQEPQAAPDIFDNAPEAIRHTVAPQFDQINQTVLANARLIAGMKYSDDEVDTAEKAFIEAVQSQRLDPADYHKVVGSPNRYAAAVQGHKRQQAQAEIGDDPAAFRAKVEAEILAKHGLQAPANGAAHQQPQQPAPVMPSNLATARNVGSRGGPAWSGPKPLDDIFKR
jgi:hypothetical protein